MKQGKSVVRSQKGGKGVIRSLAHQSTSDRKLHPAERRGGRVSEPTLCERCGAVLVRRSWRRGGDLKPSHTMLAGAAWTTCPACVQVENEEYLGRVTLDGDLVASSAAALRRRIANVAARAEHTQVERRVVSVDRTADGKLVVLTTSQKLAHRIVHELKKAFGGRATYRWSDDGSLEARLGFGVADKQKKRA
ncbi:hypothetical protein K2Z84_17845 [Candidatus Binatia bacterium]|nr:hypothetical protein [Candidatus Binatia bacterium]